MSQFQIQLGHYGSAHLRIVLRYQIDQVFGVIRIVALQCKKRSHPLQFRLPIPPAYLGHYPGRFIYLGIEELMPVLPDELERFDVPA